MVFSRLFIFSFYGLFVLIHSINLMAGSEFNEAPPKGYRAPHSSMMPTLNDPNVSEGFNRFALEKKLGQVEDQRIVLTGIEESRQALESTTISTAVAPTRKGSASHPTKIKVHKEKELKKAAKEKKGKKKPKATVKSTRKQEEKISSVGEEETKSGNDSRPITMIIKPDEEPNDPQVRESFSKKSNNNKGILPSSTAPNIFDELLSPKSKGLTFKAPVRLEMQDLLLILMADTKANGQHRKVYLPRLGVSANFKIFAKGNIADLTKFLCLNDFKHSKPLATLKKYFTKEEGKPTKVTFSENEYEEIKNAEQELTKEIRALALEQAWALLNDSERRPESTLVGHNSIYTEHKLIKGEDTIQVKGQDPVQDLILGLTFYRPS